MDIFCQKNAENLGIFKVYGHEQIGKLFRIGLKVNIYAYVNRNIKCFDFLNDFRHFETDKVVKI